jgi:serine/threonine-protein kinase
LPLGELFMDRYRVVRCLAHGGMGAVYEVVHKQTERPLALKVLLPIVLADEDARGRFSQEARVTARVQSDHIVDVVDAGVDPETGMPFLVMELLHGDDLGEVVAKGPVAPELAVLLLGQAAVALDRCHAANIVHRDLKPGNIMITRRDDGSPQTKILDFGVAKVLRPGALTTGTRSVGTTLYMAPEQLTGDHALSPAADRYSLAQLAYTMLVGKPYFQKEAAELEPYPLLAVVAEGPREPASARAKRAGARLPRAFDAWFARATELEPTRRPSSAADLVFGLAAALAVEPPPFLRTRERAAEVARDARAPSPGRRVGVVVLGAIVLGAIVAILFLWPREGTTGSNTAADATSDERARPPATAAEGRNVTPGDADPIASTGQENTKEDRATDPATTGSAPSAPAAGRGAQASPPRANDAQANSGRKGAPGSPSGSATVSGESVPTGAATSATPSPTVESPW